MANEVTSSINFKYLSKEAESFLDNAGDNFFDSEYDCFLQCHKEYLEELEED